MEGTILNPLFMLNTKGENQQHVQAVLFQIKANDNSGSKKHHRSQQC